MFDRPIDCRCRRARAAEVLFATAARSSRISCFLGHVRCFSFSRLTGGPQMIYPEAGESDPVRKWVPPHQVVTDRPSAAPQDRTDPLGGLQTGSESGGERMS